MNSICLIGAGSFGIHHLEGLLRSEGQLSITVVETSEEARKRVSEVFLHYGKTGSVVTEIPAGSFDLAIIATTSRSRAQVVRELLATADVRTLIMEKILFANESDYAEIDSLLREKRVPAWVNCSLRLMPVRKDLKGDIGSDPVHIHFDAGDRYGLMTNIMHYADYAGFLASSPITSVDTSLLSPRLIGSKRSGYCEMFGTIVVDFENGSRMLATSLPQSRDRRTVISAPRVRAVLEEPSGTARISRARDDWKWIETPAPFLQQSEMSGALAKRILETGACELPTFEESSAVHLSILRAIRDFLREHSIKTDVDFPFT